MRFITKILGVVSSSIILIIGLFLLYFSAPILESGDIFTTLFSSWNPPREFGLYPMIIGSILISGMATVLASIFSISIALLFDSLRGERGRGVVRAFMNLMASIPTVVYAFIGVVVLVPIIRNSVGGTGMSVAAASLVLSVVITPTIVLFLMESFSSVPVEYRDVNYALGGERVDYQIGIMIPFRVRGVVAAISLGFARAVGDTMIALMVAGNSAIVPHSIFSTARTLTSHIALMFAGDFDSLEFRSIFLSGLVLLSISTVVTLIVNTLAKDRGKI